MAEPVPATTQNRSTLIGILCGVCTAVFWAAGFATARHGIEIGFTPADLTVHRCVWGGLILLPWTIGNGFADFHGIGPWRAVVLTLLGGPGIAMLSYSGFLFVPLGHGSVIQPSCAALFGLLLAAVVLGEKLPLQRVLGAIAIVIGLAVIGAEGLATMGVHGAAGDLLFVAAGATFAAFGMFLRKWHLAAVRATIIVSVVSVAILPVYAAFVGFDRMIALGWRENLMQAAIQGILAGPLAIYLFTRAVVLLGAGRAAVFPSLVPPSALLIGWAMLGTVPTPLQLIGLVVVLIGFRLTQRG